MGMHRPRTRGELVDHLGWMIMTSPRFSTEVVFDGNADLAFRTLGDGIDGSSGLSAEDRTRLHQMADEARAMFDVGDIKGGNFRLGDMQQHIRKHGWGD